MKRSEFIQKVLHHDLNTVFVNKEQVERILVVFEDLGMLPPETELEKCSDPILTITPSYFIEYVSQEVTLGWDDE